MKTPASPEEIHKKEGEMQFIAFVYAHRLPLEAVEDFDLVGIHAVGIPAALMAQGGGKAPAPRDVWVSWGGHIPMGPLALPFLEGRARIRLGRMAGTVFVPIVIHPAHIADLAAAARSGQGILRVVLLGSGREKRMEIPIPEVPPEILAILREHPPVPEPLMGAALQHLVWIATQEVMFGVMEAIRGEIQEDPEGRIRSHWGSSCPGHLERGARGEIRCAACGMLLAASN